MSPIIVRNVDETVVRRLGKRAARHRCSMNDEMCNILREAVSKQSKSATRRNTVRVKRRPYAR